MWVRIHICLAECNILLVLLLLLFLLSFKFKDSLNIIIIHKLIINKNAIIQINWLNLNDYLINSN